MENRAFALCGRDCFDCPYSDCCVDDVTRTDRELSEYLDEYAIHQDNWWAWVRFKKSEKSRIYEYYHGIRIKQRPAQRKVYKLSETGEIIATFDSVKSAAQSVNRKPQGIVMCCKGKRKTMYGYKWRYAEDMENGNDNRSGIE